MERITTVYVEGRPQRAVLREAEEGATLTVDGVTIRVRADEVAGLRQGVAEHWRREGRRRVEARS